MGQYSSTHITNARMNRNNVKRAYQKSYTQWMRKKKARMRRIRTGVIAAVILGCVCITGSSLLSTDTLLRLRLACSGCPESICQFVEQYPESISFADNYRRYHNQDVKYVPEKNNKDGDIPLYIQWDLHWGYKTYGNNFLGITGCGPTCLSMVYTGLTKDDQWNPAVVASWAEQQGYYVDGVGTAWSMMTDGADTMGLSSTQIGVSEKEIRKALENGNPVICSMSPGDFTRSGHFIVLAGIYSDGSIKVNDPNSLKNSQRHWCVDELTRQMKAAWSYSYL